MTQEELAKELQRRAIAVKEQIRRLEEAKWVSQKTMLMVIGPRPR